MERKEFLRSACALCGIAIAGNILTSCEKESATQPSANFTVDLTSSAYSALNIACGAKLINKVYVINKDGSNFIGVSSVCTHEGCTINYLDTASGFVCPCHQATFAISGAVTAGPARTNLKVYTVTKSGNTLTVTG